MTGTLAEDIAPPAFDLYIPPPRALTSVEELQFCRRALELAPRSMVLRFKLAGMLQLADRFRGSD